MSNKRGRKRKRMANLERIGVRLDPELLRELTRRAEAEKRSLSNYIRRVLVLHLEPAAPAVTATPEPFPAAA